MSFQRLLSTLGALVFLLRTVRGWSIRDLEKKAGISKGMLSKIEHGRTNPCLRTIEKLAAAFEKTPAELIGTAEWAEKGGA